MGQYINKDTVVAKIKRLSKKAIELYGYSQFNTAYNNVLESIDTLEVKESLSLTWQDIRLIAELGNGFMNSEESDNLDEEEYYTEILNMFNTQKGEQL